MTGYACPPDCQCSRHYDHRGRNVRVRDDDKRQPCPPGCQCGRHRVHPPDCQCGKHKGQKKPKTKESLEKQVATRRANGQPWHTDATKDKIGDGNRGKVISDDQKKKLSESHRDFQTDATKKKIGDANRGKVRTDEMKRHLSEMNTGKKASDDTRATLSRAQRKLWDTMTPEERTRRLDLWQTSKHRSNTSIELAVQEQLVRHEISFIPQYKVRWYTVDIYIPELNLCVECDGDYWHSGKKSEDHDRRKDAYLTSHGYNVLRLKGSEIEITVEELVWNSIAEKMIA